jgi:hypothetical protein
MNKKCGYISDQGAIIRGNNETDVQQRYTIKID